MSPLIATTDTLEVQLYYAMLRCYLMDPDTDVCQTEQPQISYSVDFTAEQSSAMGSPILLDREGSALI